MNNNDLNDSNRKLLEYYAEQAQKKEELSRNSTPQLRYYLNQPDLYEEECKKAALVENKQWIALALIIIFIMLFV